MEDERKTNSTNFMDFIIKISNLNYNITSNTFKKTKFKSNSNKIEFKIEVCNTKTTRLKITTSNNNTVSLIAVHLRIN